MRIERFEIRVQNLPGHFRNFHRQKVVPVFHRENVHVFLRQTGVREKAVNLIFDSCNFSHHVHASADQLTLVADSGIRHERRLVGSRLQIHRQVVSVAAIRLATVGCDPAIFLGVTHHKLNTLSFEKPGEPRPSVTRFKQELRAVERF